MPKTRLIDALVFKWVQSPALWSAALLAILPFVSSLRAIACNGARALAFLNSFGARARGNSVGEFGIRK